ncbi:MAG: DMT family transporter [Thermoprotei archaeon]
MRRKLGLLYLLAASALWGGIGVIVQTLVPNERGVPLAVLIRSLSASALLLARLRFVMRGEAVVMGLISSAFYSVYVLTIVVEGTSISAAMLYTAPAFIVGYELLRGRKVTSVDYVATGLTVAGVMIIYNAELLTLYTALGLLSGFTYSLLIYYSSIMQARGFAEWDIIAAQSLWSLPPLLLASLTFWEFTAEVAAAGVLLGVVETVVAYYFFYKGMREVGPLASSLLTSLEPVFAMVYAYLILAQVLTPIQYLGASLIILSSALTALRSAR